VLFAAGFSGAGLCEAGGWHATAQIKNKEIAATASNLVRMERLLFEKPSVKTKWDY